MQFDKEIFEKIKYNFVGKNLTSLCMMAIIKSYLELAAEKENANKRLETIAKDCLKGILSNNEYLKVIGGSLADFTDFRTGATNEAISHAKILIAELDKE